jgi:chitin synthase
LLLKPSIFIKITLKSWGTKNISETTSYLGHVQTKADETTAEVVLPEQKDVGLFYEEAITNIFSTKKNKMNTVEMDPKQKQDDYYRSFRTRLVICWIFTNLILVVAICTVDSFGKLGNFNDRSNTYLAFILWSVAGLSCFRFIGSLCYRFSSLFWLS